MRNDKSEIPFQMKKAKSGDTYLQGIGDYENMLIFSPKSKQDKDKGIWRLIVKPR